METVMSLDVLRVARYVIDGQQVASAIATTAADENEHLKGLEVMKMRCPFGLIEEIGSTQLPAKLDLRVKVVGAAGGKSALEILGVKRPAPSTAGK